MEGRATLAGNLSTHTEATEGRTCTHSLALREYCCVMAVCVTNLGLDPRPPLPHPCLTLYLLSCALWLTAPQSDYGCTKHPWVSSLWLRYERNQPRAARSDVLPPPHVTHACRTVWDAGDQRLGTDSNMVQQRMWFFAAWYWLMVIVHAGGCRYPGCLLTRDEVSRCRKDATDLNCQARE